MRKYHIKYSHIINITILTRTDFFMYLEDRI